jgi:hypothetical protein
VETSGEQNYTFDMKRNLTKNIVWRSKGKKTTHHAETYSGILSSASLTTDWLQNCSDLAQLMRNQCRFLIHSRNSIVHASLTGFSMAILYPSPEEFQSSLIGFSMMTKDFMNCLSNRMWSDTLIQLITCFLGIHLIVSQFIRPTENNLATFVSLAHCLDLL